MKFQIVLGIAAQALAVAISNTGDRTTAEDPVSTRPFVLPPFPSPFPSKLAQEQSSDLVYIPPSAPNPTDVQIEGFVYGGTGCPSNTVSSVLSDDRTIMTLIFDQYVAQIGPGVSVIENRKNCQLNIDLRYPGGFQYSVFSADYRGYAYLDPGVTGVQKSIYYFSGQTAQASTQTTWAGPLDEDYLLHDQTDVTSIVWSPCGQNGAMNINSQIRLTSTNATGVGELTNDSIDTSFTQVVHVSWQECDSTTT